MANKQAIICDLDGTLAHIDHRDPYDASTCERDGLNLPVFQVLQRFAGEAMIILVSGRQEQWKSQTMNWLKNHCVPYDLLLMRKTNDFRKDTVIKKELFNAHIKNKYQVLFVLDDRDQVVKMWRENDLTCFQVAEGNF